MKKAILVLSVLGMGVIQASNAAVISMTNNTLITPSKSNISVPANYAITQNSYSSSNGSVFVSDNDEIIQAIDSLSASAKTKTNKKKYKTDNTNSMYIRKSKDGQILLTSRSNLSGNFDKFTQTVKSTIYRSSPNENNVGYEEKSDSSTYAESAFDALR